MWFEWAFCVESESVWKSSDDRYNQEKWVNTEMFIDRTAALYIGEMRIRVVTAEGDQQVGTSWLEEQEMLSWRKRCENESSGVNLSWNKLIMGTW